MRRILPEVRDLGAELVLVGTGTPEQARTFRDQQEYPGPVWTDPHGRSQALAGLRRGIAATFAPGALPGAAQAFREGFRQGSVAGDPWQQGGVLVVAPGGAVSFRHVNAHPADHTPPERVLEELRRAVAPREPEGGRGTGGGTEPGASRWGSGASEVVDPRGG